MVRQAPAPRVGALQEEPDTFGGITEMITAIMPLIMIMMMMGMLMPMMRGIGGGSS